MALFRNPSVEEIKKIRRIIMWVREDQQSEEIQNVPSDKVMRLAGASGWDNLYIGYFDVQQQLVQICQRW